jgi:phosphohistidine phosphatase
VTERHLVLLRHAQAAHPDGARDVDRPLTDVGRRQCATVAEHLHEHGPLPQLVLCSAAARTRETWELVAAGLPDANPEVRHLDELYETRPTDLVALLAALPDDVTSVLVVGHEPVMSGTAAVLAGPGSDDAAVARVRVGVPTASLAFLDTSRAWADLEPGTAELTEIATAPKN